MPAENESPAREPAIRGRGRGGRGGRGAGRGRGGGRLAATAAVTAAKLSAARPGRGGSRRGRAKVFADSHVQASYERQRHLKANYQAVAHALKGALQELAERNIEKTLQNPDFYKKVPEYEPVVRRLQKTLTDRLAVLDRRRQMGIKVTKQKYDGEVYVTESQFGNALEDLDEQAYEGQENRARILNSLRSKGLPVDIRDDQHQYKVITDSHFDREFGLYECYKNGRLIPYPSRVMGTEMWRRGRAAAEPVSAPAPSNSTAKGRGRGRAATNKRRAQEQPDGQPTPKKSTRGTDDGALQEQVAHAPAKGLLASAAEAEAHPNGVSEEDSTPASPEPTGTANGVSAAKDPGKLHAREKSPPLPKNVGEPDEYGVRVYNQRGPREKVMTSRFMARPIFDFNDWEIGFRDTYNDSSKGHTRAKRGKYLDTPNNTGWHFDHLCNGYDYTNMSRDDLDQELVERHGLHPKYGIFLPTSKNDAIESDPYNMPGKPVVFIALPSGRVSFASRSYIPTVNHRRSEDIPLRFSFGYTLRRFCKRGNITQEDYSITEYLPSFNEWKKKSLGIATKELKKRPIVTVDSETDEEAEPEQPKEVVETGMPGLSILTYASAYVAAQETVKSVPPAPNKQPRYDAIRDIFTDKISQPRTAPQQEGVSLGLNILAELCKLEPRLPGGTGTVFESEYKSPLKKEEPPQASSFVAQPPPQRVERQPSYGYTSRDRAFPPPPSAGTIPESSSYPPVDRGLPPPVPVEYKSHYPPPPGPISQDHGYYFPSHDHRDPMAQGRPIDHGYNHRRLSGYGSETAPPPQSFSRGSYWQPAAAPPHTIPQPTHFGAPPPAPSRLPFSNDPLLPPLRPPRRNPSLPDEPMNDQRPSIHGGIYYPPAPSRLYHRGGFPTEPLAPLQPMPAERMLSNPQAQGYMGSPPPGYAHQVLSPTFGNPGLPGSLGQSPPGTPHGPHSGIHRHRSTLSGSSDAGSSKYRKLQPAPVPANRNWPNKPELKTIPYDHKETGSSAALPSSGPTQIRGWNVNQPRKRSKAEKLERAESNNDRDDSR